MLRIRLTALLLLALAGLLSAPPTSLAQDAGGGNGGAGAPGAGGDAGAGNPPPPAPDLRFFPKELEDALKLLSSGEDEETLFEALLRIQRMLPLDGAREPLRKDAFAPVFERALSTRHDAFASEAGGFLAALDREALTASLKEAISADKHPRRMRNATYLAEQLGLPEGVTILVEDLAPMTHEEVRSRVVEALGYLKAQEGFNVIVANMGNKNPEIRNCAATALGYMADPRGVPHLLRGLGESKAEHGMFCAEALGRIEDASIFDAVMQRGGGGSDVIHKAKAIEVCARAANIDDLIGLLQKGTAPVLRTAAANALSRLVRDGEATGYPVPAEKRDLIADSLLEKMVADKEPTVRAASFWALRMVAVDSTAEKAMKRMGVKGEDKLIYLVTLLGELKHKPAAPILYRALMTNREVMLRRAAAAAFWNIDDEDTIEQFGREVVQLKDVRSISAACDAIGSWKNPRGFDLALKMLKTQREGSKEQWQVELALEKMTGHFFGPYPGVWNKWFEKNPDFFTHKQGRIEREKWREDFDKENKGFRHTKETERAVQMGLSWLARHQNYDGVWDSSGFLKHCWEEERCGRKGGGRTAFAAGGTTGISCLAFLGAGYTPERGKYHHNIRRALDSLMAMTNSEGDFDQGDLLWNRSYARPIALQALAEGYSSTGYMPYRLAAERILMRTFSLQNERGGWRYSLQRGVPELDSSVTAWVLFAVKSADKAGIPVPSMIYEGAYNAFDYMSERVPQGGPYESFADIDPDYGYEVGKGTDYEFQTGYMDTSGAAGRATTPLGLMSRIFLGWRRSHPFCIGSANYIATHYLPEFDVFGEPGKEDWSRMGRFAPQAIWGMYNYYYCTLAMHQMGGQYFYKWNRRIKVVLPRVQKQSTCERGSWEGWSRDSAFGWLYTTSLGVMTLETYYRYLPILQD